MMSAKRSAALPSAIFATLLLLTTFVMVAVMPARAHADQPEAYGLWVAGTQVTEQNADDILGDGAASFDSETETLTLVGATIGQGNVQLDGSTVLCGIAATDDLDTLCITFAGDVPSTITASSTDESDTVCGIYCDTELIIYGEGALDINVGGQDAEGIKAPSNSVKVYDGATVNVSFASSGMAGIEAMYFEARDANVTVGEGADTGISAHGWVYAYGLAKVAAQGSDYGVWCPAFLMEDYAYLKAKGTGRFAHGLHFEYGAVQTQYGSFVDTVDIRDYAQLEAQGISGAVDKALRTDFYSNSTTAKSLIKVAPNAPESLVDTTNVDPTTCYYLLMPAYRAYPVMVATPNWEDGQPVLTQVNSSNANDVFGDGTVSYDPEANVLTLNGYNYTVGSGGQATSAALQIERSMTVELVGENSISSGDFTACQMSAINADIFSFADLTFTGDGSLDINWSANDFLDAAVVGCTITVAENAAVNVTTTKYEGDPDYRLFTGIRAYGDLAVCDNASLTATVSCDTDAIDDVVVAMGACISEEGKKLIVSDTATLDVSGTDGAICDDTNDGLQVDWSNDGLQVDWSGYEQREYEESPLIEVCAGARREGNTLDKWDGEGSLTATFDFNTGAVTRNFRWVRIAEPPAPYTVTFDGNGHGGVLATLQVPREK
ncbi:MAG: hypothetical protein IJH04_09860, partial [Eggerthellaceae bacterium]|nr:hypothetical protein [Eggerthellaceae bacterium]